MTETRRTGNSTERNWPAPVAAGRLTNQEFLCRLLASPWRNTFLIPRASGWTIRRKFRTLGCHPRTSWILVISFSKRFRYGVGKKEPSFALPNCPTASLSNNPIIRTLCCNNNKNIIQKEKYQLDRRFDFCVTNFDHQIRVTNLGFRVSIRFAKQLFTRHRTRYVGGSSRFLAIIIEKLGSRNGTDVANAQRDSSDDGDNCQTNTRENGFNADRGESNDWPGPASSWRLYSSREDSRPKWDAELCSRYLRRVPTASIVDEQTVPADKQTMSTNW